MGANLGLRNLVSAEVQNQGDGDLFQIIAYGRNKMPAYAGKLSDAEITQLVAYTRGLGSPPSAPPPVDDAVITIDGLCDSPPARDTTVSDCRTVITRAQFEALANMLQPNMNAAMKRQLAQTYSRLLVMARKAHEMGLDQGTEFEERVKFARMQISSQVLTQALQERAGGNSAAFKQAMEAINNSTVRTLNPNYFGASTPSPSPAENQRMSPPLKEGQRQAEQPFAPIAPPPPPTDAPPPPPKSIALGQTKDQVVASFGQPQKIVNLRAKEMYYYPDMKVTFVNGKVTDVQ